MAWKTFAEAWQVITFCWGGQSTKFKLNRVKHPGCLIDTCTTVLLFRRDCDRIKNGLINRLWTYRILWKFDDVSMHFWHVFVNDDKKDSLSWAFSMFMFYFPFDSLMIRKNHLVSSQNPMAFTTGSWGKGVLWHLQSGAFADGSDSPNDGFVEGIIGIDGWRKKIQCNAGDR